MLCLHGGCTTRLTMISLLFLGSRENHSWLRYTLSQLGRQALAYLSIYLVDDDM